MNRASQQRVSTTRLESRPQGPKESYCESVVLLARQLNGSLRSDGETAIQMSEDQRTKKKT